MSSSQEPRILDFNRFVRTDLRKAVMAAATNHQILNEGDFQTFCSDEIKLFIKKNDKIGIFRVHNNIYFQEFRTYPDIVIFRKDRPWVVIELKEGRHLRANSAQKDMEKMYTASEGFRLAARRLRPKRCYVLYLAQMGDKRDLHELKKIAPRYIFAVPFIMSDHLDEQEFKTWLAKRAPLAKYRGSSYASLRRKRIDPVN
jgi:hypothetical protein